MKKKVIICLVSVLIIFGITIFIFLNNRITSVITLDINPSIQINLDKNEKVKSVTPLNDDAKDIVSGNLKNKSLDSAIDSITKNLIDNGYVSDENTIEILLYIKGKISGDEVYSKLRKSFEDKQVTSFITMIDNITKEDEKLAMEYNISLAKAAYINSILKDNKNIDVMSLVDKSVRELSDTKETGRYCDNGYDLEGSFCIKEIGREKASNGKVCPRGYYLYEGKCYEEVGVVDTDELECFDGFQLSSDKCIGTERVEAKANFTCDVGDLVKRGIARKRDFRDSGDPEQYVCEDKSNATYPTERCYTSEHAIINGVCAMGPKPLLPTPSGCEGDDINYNGGCYDPTPSEPYVCPNGERFDTNDELCFDTFNYTIAKGSYSCNNGEALDGNMCIREVSEDPIHKRVCPSGYSMVDDSKCINYNKVTDLVDGYVCDKENTRVDGDSCIILEIIDSKISTER